MEVRDMSLHVAVRANTVEVLAPIDDKLVIVQEPAETTTAGGIVIPDNAQMKPTIGKVIAAGPGKKADDGSIIEMTVKEGDRVLFQKYAGGDVKLKGIQYTVIKEADVLCILLNQAVPEQAV